MKDLKLLTSEQCIKIATFAEPEIKWKFIVSENVWNGFDLIEEDSNENDCKYIFQICFEDDIHIHQRFRFYDDCYQYLCTEESINKILKYIESL